MQTDLPRGATVPPLSQASEAVLRMYEVTKRYGSRVAVKQLNLEVRRGEIVGFLGLNGAGKTTSIRMLLDLIPPPSGQVELFGQDLATRRASLQPRVGALVEAPALYLHLCGKSNGARDRQCHPGDRLHGLRRSRFHAGVCSTSGKASRALPEATSFLTEKEHKKPGVCKKRACYSA